MINLWIQIHHKYLIRAPTNNGEGLFDIISIWALGLIKIETKIDITGIIINQYPEQPPIWIVWLRQQSAQGKGLSMIQKYINNNMNK